MLLTGVPVRPTKVALGKAFHRWVMHCMAAAGLKDLAPLDVLVLHHVTHRARDKRLADICFIMNVEDTHLVNYALKKLQTLGVVASQKMAKRSPTLPPIWGAPMCSVTGRFASLA